MIMHNMARKWSEYRHRIFRVSSKYLQYIASLAKRRTFASSGFPDSYNMLYCNIEVRSNSHLTVPAELAKRLARLLTDFFTRQVSPTSILSLRVSLGSRAGTERRTAKKNGFYPKLLSFLLLHSSSYNFLSVIFVLPLFSLISIIDFSKIIFRISLESSKLLVL